MVSLPLFAELLRRHRLHANLSQQALAERARLSVDGIAALERGRRTAPRPDTVALLCDALDLAGDDRTAFVAAAVQARNSITRAPAQRVEPAHSHEWSDAPGAGMLYGRESETDQLAHWLNDANVRLVAVLGMGGVGKTALAAHVARRNAGYFEIVLWRSLLNAPPPADILVGWLRALSGHRLVSIPDSLDERLDVLVSYLRRRRCLLVLDNAETVMRQGDRAGSYRAGYEPFGQLLERIARAEHQSCLLLTSREQARLQADTAGVRVLHLGGLESAVACSFLADRGLVGMAGSAAHLSERYSGNPLALKLVADTIQEVFSGVIDTFLREESLIFDDIRDVLDQQFARLAPLERDILLWMAIERESVDEAQLRQRFERTARRRDILEALRSLLRRSLVERYGNAFGLQNVVTEYLTDMLVGQAEREITHETPALLDSHALIKTTAREYVRQSQERVLLQPLADRLVRVASRNGAAEHISRMLAAARHSGTRRPGFLAGNLLNLLVSMGVNIRDLDLSGLCVWQAFLRGADLQGVDFSGADLTGSVFNDYAGAVTTVALSPDGRLLAAGMDTGAIYVWHTTDQQLLGVCRGHSGHLGEVTWSPDGSMLASSSDDTTVRIWDTASWQTLRVLRGHTGGLTSVAFHPGGKLVASAGMDSAISVWDAHSGERLHALEGHTSGIHSLVWNGDGSLLASASHDHTVRVWDGQNGELKRVLEGHSASVAAIAWQPGSGGTLVSGGHDRLIRVWDALHGKLLASFEGHSAPVIAAAFADAHLLVTGGDDQLIRVWNFAESHCPQILHTLDSHYGAVNALSIRHSGGLILLASGSQDRTVRLWDVRSGHALAVLRGSSKWLQTLAFTPDGELLVGGSDGQSVRVWDGRSGRTVHALRGHTSLTEKLALRPDGAQMASAGWDATVRVWDTRHGGLLHVLRGHSGAVAVAAFGPGETGHALIATGGLDHTVRVWDALTGQPRGCWSGHSNRVVALAFHPDGARLASGSWDSTIRVWEIGQPDTVQVLCGHTAPIECVAFDRSGRLLASGGWDTSVRIWDLKEGRELHVLEAHCNGLEAVVFSPDGSLLASCACDYLVCVWDVAAGRLRHRLEGHTSWVRCVAFSPDGALLASGGDDGVVRVWDISVAGQGACLQTIAVEDPYTGMRISGAIGLNSIQNMALQALGAVDHA